MAVKSMKKADLLNLVRDELELGTKKGAQDFLDNLDKVIEKLAETLETDEKVKLSKYFSLQRKHFPRKEGKAMGKDYVIEEREEIVIKKCNAIKGLLK